MYCHKRHKMRKDSFGCYHCDQCRIFYSIKTSKWLDALTIVQWIIIPIIFVFGVYGVLK